MADTGRSRRARTTEDGGAGRCLSDLSDDLLRHIIFLAPDKDGAATAVLSRRWRWLWRTSGAVYVDTRSFCVSMSKEQKLLAFIRGDQGMKALARQEHEAFVRGAEKALADATMYGPIRRLTFFIAKDSNVMLLTRWCTKENRQMEHNVMEALVSKPAARRVEELQIVVRASNTGFKLSFCALPSEALRVLRITGCSQVTAAPRPGGATAFPMLVDLHLQNCCISLVDLQRFIGAAPLLSNLHLTSSHLSAESSNDAQQRVGRLLIPVVSVLELADCSYRYGYLELDVPRLRFFRYKGEVDHSNRLSLKSQVSDLHVDLQLSHGNPRCFNQVSTTTRESFWRFIQNFNTTKHLTLRMDCFAMDGLAFIDKASRDEHLGGLSFSLLEKLELEAEFYTGFESLLANLLHCCPVTRDLRIKLIKKNTASWIESSIDHTNKGGVQFDMSVSAFRNRRSRSMVSLGPENEDNYQDYGVIPGLTSEQSSFSCLQSQLKRVSLHFFMDEPNCLGVKLAKFFAKNAMVLQELYIDDGSHEMLEHANSSLRRWTAKKVIYGKNQLNVKDC